jgi:NADPH-dependent curcumin reductase CurA
MRSREWRLAARPRGWPEPSDFELAERDVPGPAAGQVLVRNEFFSVDPYMRGRMNDAPGYAAPYQIGKAMYGGAVGRVVESAADDLPVGTLVRTNRGWRSSAPPPSRSGCPSTARRRRRTSACSACRG